VPLDNNAAERALRGPVVGKNHYGSGSLRGTQIAALFYTLCETAKLVGVDPHVYLLRAFSRPRSRGLERLRCRRSPRLNASRVESFDRRTPVPRERRCDAATGVRRGHTDVQRGAPRPTFAKPDHNRNKAHCRSPKHSAFANVRSLSGISVTFVRR
jgi:hypothetical protein